MAAGDAPISSDSLYCLAETDERVKRCALLGDGPTQVPVTCWLEAFAAHPRIGDVDSLRKRFGAFTEHSRSEQATAATASSDVLQVRSLLREIHSCMRQLCPTLKGVFSSQQELLRMNQTYEAKFGHIFIICASGKSADEMLAALQQRQVTPLTTGQSKSFPHFQCP